MATATAVAPTLDKDLEAGESTPLIQKNAQQASINADSKPLGEMNENAYKETAVMGAAIATCESQDEVYAIPSYAVLAIYCP
jgi:hypothetical protein